MKWLINLFGKAETLFRKIKEKLLFKFDSQYRQLRKWYAEDPQNLKKIDFPFLDEHSVVFDLGGYEGQWSSDIYARYNCTIHVFEPASIYSDLIKKRFQNNDKIHVHSFGLAGKTEQATMIINKFSSKIVTLPQSGNNYETVRLINFDEFLIKNSITIIDFIKINIEGAEFDLLEYLLLSGSIIKIKNLLIQFHNFVPQAEERRKKIQEALQLHYCRQFDYPFIWESWAKRES